MSDVSNCSYCMEGELVAAFGIKICELDHAKVYLFKEQSHKGRCIVASKKHASDMTELTPEERAGFFEDMNKVANAIHKAFSPDKINYGAYGDTAKHMHFHLVPKYKDGFEWAGIFQMDPKQTVLSDAEYDEIIAEIKKYL